MKRSVDIEVAKKPISPLATRTKTSFQPNTMKYGPRTMALTDKGRKKKEKWRKKKLAPSISKRSFTIPDNSKKNNNSIPMMLPGMGK